MPAVQDESGKPVSDAASILSNKTPSPGPSHSPYGGMPSFTASPSEGTLSPSPTSKIVYKDPRINRQAFNKLLKINKDIVGWIRIPDTMIDYPVLQGKDNDYYLTHSVNNEVIKNASIFMDYRNEVKVLDFNTIIYGHNMHDATMFGYLPEYKDEDFYKKHSIVYFDTLYASGRWEIFSVYVTDLKFDYTIPGFRQSEDRQAFIDNIKAKSLYKSDMDITPEDKILTLSTCSYEFENARLVIHAKLIN